MKTLFYVTGNKHKREEYTIFMDSEQYFGKNLRELVSVQFVDLSIEENLEVDLVKMVSHEVLAAYNEIQVPCIVEHAGLIFEDYRDNNYPGGLTKPMWNTLGDRFIDETHSANRPVIAQAAVAYCNGKRVKTFIGETRGTIAPRPRGSRDFYWDTIFIPHDDARNPEHLTYAEIATRATLGVAFKLKEFSQSARAMRAFFEYFLSAEEDYRFWPYLR